MIASLVLPENTGSKQTLETTMPVARLAGIALDQIQAGMSPPFTDKANISKTDDGIELQSVRACGEKAASG